MICPHCGNNIPKDADICSHCGKPTQFSLKFNYKPARAPIGSSPTSTNERAAYDTRSDPTNSTEITRAITKALPTKRAVQLWLYKQIGISLLAVILSSLVCLIMVSSSNRRMEKSIENLRQTSTTITTTYSTSPTPTVIPIGTRIYFVANPPTTVSETLVKDLPEEVLKTNGIPYTLEAEPSLEEYTFTGWNTQRDGNGGSYPKDSVLNFDTVSGTLTLYAQWATSDANSTVIRFDANLPESARMDDLMNMPGEEKKFINEPISLSQEPTLLGYSFVEWNTKADRTGISIKSGATFDINLDMDILTLYAQWDENN